MQDEPEGGTPKRATRDWRRALGVVGKVFISLGLLILAFVAYQLWGTGIEFRANQDDLAKEFREAIASVTDPSNPTVETEETTPPETTQSPGSNATPSTAAATTTTTDPLARLEKGDLLAAIKMPTISDATFYVVAGVTYGDLKRGIGHYPGTSLPGQFGNAALAGHRTTYGAPFEDLDRLQPGDPIIIDTVNGGHYEYLVERQEIINPDRIEVLAPPKNPKDVILTLTTCHPKRSVAQRLIVYARLNPETSSSVAKRSKRYSKKRPAPPAVVATSTTVAPTTSVAPTTAAAVSTPSTTVSTADTTPATDPAVTEPETDDTSVNELAGEDLVGGGNGEVLASGWFDDTGAWPHIILWGLLLAGVALGINLGGRRLGRRWRGVAIGAAPFLVVLYFFFQNVNRLLPPGL